MVLCQQHDKCMQSTVCRQQRWSSLQGSGGLHAAQEWQECSARVWCFGCMRPVAPLEGGSLAEEPGVVVKCGECSRVFCFDCDAYIHESLHNCPGCECLAAEEEDDPMEES